MAKNDVKKTKYYWLLIVAGVLLFVLGILFAPFWKKMWADCPWGNWGNKIVSIFMAVLLIAYLAGFLFKKMTHSKGTIQVLTIIEFVLLSLIALGLVFSQFNLLNIPDNPSVIIGIALYSRGTIEIFRAYYYQRTNQIKYPVWWLVVAILFVTFGVFLMVSPVVTKEMLVWVLAGVLVVAGLVALIYGCLAKPASSGAKKEPKAKKEKSSKKAKDTKKDKSEKE